MKKNILKIVSIFVILVIIMNTNIILAVTAPDTSALTNEKKANENKINEANSELQEVQTQKTETIKQVESISSQIETYETQIEELETKLSDLNTKISNAEKEIKEKEENYNQNEKLLQERLVAAYEAGDTSYLDVILSSENLTDLISNYYLVSELATYDAELLEKIQKEKEEIQKTKENLETNKKAVTSTKTEKEKVSIQLQQSRKEKANYVSQLSEDEKQIQSQIEELKQANKQIDKDIEAKKKAYQEQIEALKNNNNSSNNSGSNSNSNYSGGASSAGFIRPVNSYITTGIYYSNGSYHGGVDFGASGINGSPVFAVATGVVITTRALTTSYGNYIIIYHPSSNLYTLYAHGQAGSICVSEGQVVKQGQQIMRVGNTGNSTGPHLHFEVRKSPGTYANRVNPTAYLP